MKNKIVIDMDIEALNMNYIRGGFPAGKSLYYAYSVRDTGKSVLNELYGKIVGNNLCKEIMLLHSTQKPKYQFSRAKWYEAPRPGVASWNTFSNEYHDILNWCVENFGPHPKKPDAWSRWYMGIETVNFRDEKDYAWFMLRWA